MSLVSPFPPLGLSHLFSWFHLLLSSFFSDPSVRIFTMLGFVNSNVGLYKPLEKGILIEVFN